MIAINFITQKDKWLRQGLLFRKAIYVYLIFFCIQLFFEYNWLLSSDSVYFFIPPSGYGIGTALNLLSHQVFLSWSWLFLLCLIFGCVIGLAGWFPRITAVVIWFLTVNINNRIELTGTGGEILLNNLLFFQIFFSDGKHPTSEVWRSISSALDNVSVIACRLQVLVVYLLSALYKLLDETWVSGDALGIIFSIPDYSYLWVRQTFESNSLVLKLMTWFSIIYQFVFPILVWLKPIKKYLLILGIILHIGIAVTMGLYNFSAVMIIAYLLFL